LKGVKQPKGPDGKMLSATDVAIVCNFLKITDGGFSQKINAIKHVRTVTGWGLKESKDYVDALDAMQK
jgi:ribosomal protein L7/L12